LRAIGAARSPARVRVMMHEANARKMNAALGAINDAAIQDVIVLGRPGTMLEVREALRAGEVVGLLADRALANEVHGIASSSEAQYRELIGLITSYSNDFSRVQSANNERYQRIAREIQDLKAAAAAGGLQQNR